MNKKGSFGNFRDDNLAIGRYTIQILDMGVGFKDVIDQCRIGVMVIIPGEGIESLSFGHFDGLVDANLLFDLGFLFRFQFLL